MSDRRKFEVIESRQLDHLRIFHDVARTLTGVLELDQILQLIVDQMVKFFGSEQWFLLLTDEQSSDLRFAIAVGFKREELKEMRPVPQGQGVVGRVALSGEPLIVSDVSQDPEWRAYLKKHPDQNIRSVVYMPIRQGNQTLGVIQLNNSKADLLSEYTISFLRILCDYAAIAIQNARTMKLIRQLTITDDCTNLFNARYLYEVLEQNVELRERGTRVPFSLLFLDLDRFKNVNDTYGHLVGSKLLAEIGDLLRREIGPSNLGFRYGGDEFVMMLPRVDKDAAVSLTRRVREALRSKTFLTSQSLALRVAGSFGLATYPEDGATVHAIMKAADTMMYDVKNTTRDAIAVYGRGLLPEHSELPEPGVARESSIHAVVRG